MDKIADRIMQAMKSSNTTYVDLAQRTGISKSALQRYATGVTEKIPLDRLEVIASALGIAPEYLLGWTDEKSKQDRYPADSIFRQYKYLNDEMKSLSELSFMPNGVSTLDTQRALTLITKINKEIVHTPRVAVAIDNEDAVTGLKYIMCFLHLDWRKYDDVVFEDIIKSPLFGDFLKNLLNMYGEQRSDNCSN